MPVHFECSSHPPCDVRAGDRLAYDPERGAACPECGADMRIYIETVSIREVER